MPLFADGLFKIRRSLELVAAGKSSPFVKIGFFTPLQLDTINSRRQQAGLQPIHAVIVCNAKHLYKSRCTKDGYSINEVIDQIAIAFHLATDVAQGGWSTVLRSPEQRLDLSGHRIRDELVFECTQRHPYAALFSVIPRGDGRGPAPKR